jgi:hypothetical protein
MLLRVYKGMRDAVQNKVAEIAQKVGRKQVALFSYPTQANTAKSRQGLIHFLAVHERAELLYGHKIRGQLSVKEGVGPLAA